MDINLAALTKLPELGARSFTVRRCRVVRSVSGTSLVPETNNVTGIIQPLSQPALSASPDETRAEKAIAVYTAFPLSAGTNDGLTVIAADEVIVPGDGAYRVVSVSDWGHFGFFRAEARRSATLPPLSEPLSEKYGCYA